MQSSTFMLLRGDRTISLLSVSAVAIGTVIALGLVQDVNIEFGKPAQPFIAPGAAQREMTVQISAPTPQLHPLSPIVPISVEMRVTSRPNIERSAVRAGSLRADITRYNAEHRHVPPTRRALPYVPPPHNAWPYVH
ncbi:MULTISPECIES: hypothetical protein [Mycetohabitans]|nr:MULTISPECIES: hypothetical protein [Mycetohabitans]MCG1048095.1 hypothetical protein [Mycetohabitans sp. B6]